MNVHRHLYGFLLKITNRQLVPADYAICFYRILLLSMTHSEPSTQEKYRAVFLLHALGDTIGFKNGEWEFNHDHQQHNDFDYTLELIFEFIQLGGSNDINLRGWHVSDDTILHMMTAQALIDAGKKPSKKLGEGTATLLSQAMTEGHLEGRAPGSTTMESLKAIAEGKEKWNTIAYATTKGGSGASMRTSCIGLVLHEHSEVLELVEVAYINSQITHNSAVGILGGITSAYFTSLAFNNVSIKKWPHKLLLLIRGGEIEKIVKKYRPETLEQFTKDREVFINKWIRYVEMRFDDIGTPIENKSMRNPAYRSYFYYTHFGYKESKHRFPGSGGDDSVIIAYDCLLDSQRKWETLIVYSMLHMGDSDTVGCIAASWYGALYGFGSVPSRHLKYLESKNMLEDIANDLYKKFESESK